MSRLCPQCGGAVYRIPRRFIDRLISLVRPVRRYQCVALECAWIGNMPRGPVPDEHAVPMTTPTGIG
jgi:hypothetical protein